MSKFVAGKDCLHCAGPIASRGPKRDAKVMYCSNACKRSAQHERNEQAGISRQTRNCETCGKPFTYYRSMRPQATYCSMSCKSIGHSRKLTGRPPRPGSSRATFGKSVRRFFYDRCAICGWDETPNDIAHIEARMNGGPDRLENVTILCPNHHRKYDLGLIPVEVIRDTRASVLRPDWRDTPEWATWKTARSTLSNLVRWHPDDHQAINQARRAVKDAYRAFSVATSD